MPAAPQLHGSCDSRFAAVREELARNFAERGEVGAAVAVNLEGRPVVDLWGGAADPGGTRPWVADTLVDVFSVGKAMAALCLLILAERGEVELDAPVAHYWPEFAAAGKEEVTVAMVLSHRAGLPAIREPLREEAMYDWGGMCDTLAAEPPWWEPGTTHGYHVNTFGFLVGEIVRRVSGEGIGDFFRRNVADPLGADFCFGVGLEDDDRIAEFLFGRERDDDNKERLPDELDDIGEERRLLLRRAYFNPSGISGLGTVNTRAWRAAVMPSTNGHATARAVARIYAALAGGGAVDGLRIVAPETIELATREESAGPDFVLGRPSRFGLGFQLTQPERPLGTSTRGFGHFGAGGSLGFADPDAGIGFGYTMNLAGPRWQNARNRALIDAAYRSL